jgi:hypothetical protein
MGTAGPDKNPELCCFPRISMMLSAGAVDCGSDMGMDAAVEAEVEVVV